MERNYDIIKKIKAISEDKNHKHNYIAIKILNDTILQDFKSIDKMSKYFNTSISTLSRFAKEIGLDSYKNMNIIINDINSQRNPRVEYNLLEKTNTEMVSIISQLYEKSIKMTEEILIKSFQDVKDICFSILNANKIVFFAVGGSFNTCSDLSNKLNRLGFNTIAINDYNNAYFHIKNLNEKDVLFLVSYSGKTQEVIKAAKECKNNNLTKVISITNKEPNELAEVSDINLKVESIDPLIRNSSIFSRISIFLAIDTIYNCLIEMDSNYFNSQLEKTTIRK